MERSIPMPPGYGSARVALADHIRRRRSGEEGPDLDVVANPVVREGLPKRAVQGHAETLGDRDAAGVGGYGAPFDPMQAPDPYGPIDHGSGGGGDETSALGG